MISDKSGRCLSLTSGNRRLRKGGKTPSGRSAIGSGRLSGKTARLSLS